MKYGLVLTSLSKEHGNAPSELSITIIHADRLEQPPSWLIKANVLVPSLMCTREQGLFAKHGLSAGKIKARTVARMADKYPPPPIRSIIRQRKKWFLIFVQIRFPDEEHHTINITQD